MNMPAYKNVTRIIAIFCLAVFAVVIVAYLCGIRINRTHSLPKGLYRLVEKQPERGDIVAFWPQDTSIMREARNRGYIISGAYNNTSGQGYGLMFKTLVAMPGDVISITENGVIVNGKLLPNTKPLTHDNVGEPLPVVRLVDYRLVEHEALFVSDHLSRSFDSRYFGIQELRQIVEIVVPIWVW